MKLIFVILFTLLSACASKNENRILSSNMPEGLWIQNGCTLFNQQNKKAFPGERCIFLDDGGFISSTSTSLRRFSRSGEVLWDVKGLFHHQLNLSPDKKRILTLSSEIVVRGGEKQRDDVFHILDLDGKTVSRQSFYPHMKALGIKNLNGKDENKQKELGFDIESSHFNSIYEITENVYSDRVPWMKAGNIIVNGVFQGVLILSPDLKKILHHKLFLFSTNHLVHDVQITPSGEYLLFNNLTANKEGKTFSSIQKYDELEDKITFYFKASPPEMFYSPACGGAQDFGDMLFFSHVINGGFLYSKKKETVVFSVPSYSGQRLDLIPVQQLKLVDVSEFLKNSGL